MEKKAMFAFAVVMPLLAACGSAAVPADRLANSEAAIRSAQTMGADSDPKAALHVRLAQEQVKVAKQLIQDGDNERAAEVLDRATADADLAIALSKEVQVKKEALQAQSEVQEIRAKGAAAASTSSSPSATSTTPSTWGTSPAKPSAAPPRNPATTPKNP